MSDPVVLRQFSSRTLAAVRREVAPGSVGQAWRPALDTVWRLLRQRPGLHAGGHNIFVYEHATKPGGSMLVDFGVEVTRSFKPAGEVRPVETPAGEAAVAVHVGPYDRLFEAHERVSAWVRAHHRRLAGSSLEGYGDWSNDPAKLETTVVYLLAGT